MNILMGLSFTAFIALAMGLENAIADETMLFPGRSLTVVCVGGGTPLVQPPSPPFAPAVNCAEPNPPFVANEKLLGGTRTYTLSGGSSTALQFFASEADADSIDIQWRSKDSVPVAVSISRCAGNFDTGVIPRHCTSGSRQGSLTMTAQQDVLPNECALTDKAVYYVNFAGINILTGTPTCGPGDSCEIEVTVTIHPLED